MLPHLFRAALPLALAGTFGLQSAHADIYTWVDASGSINVSNLAPPDDARVIRVMHESPPSASDEAARRAETQALAERVQQLEDQLASARRPAPPPADYAPAPAQPLVQYIVVEQAPPTVQYVSESPPANAWCDLSWPSCGTAWGTGFYPYYPFYPSTVVVLPSNPRRVRPAPFPHGSGMHPPRRPSLVQPFATSPVQPLSTSLVQPLVPPLRPPHAIAGFRKG